jgi:23S rRNA (adenine2030-N6)-methyltransferase
VGDAWKHVAWLALLRSVRHPVSVLDTHAGEGRYRLGRTGEWTAGIGRLPQGDPLVDDLVNAMSAPTSASPPPAADGSRDGRVYPGSPVLTALASQPGDRATLVEADPAACAVLRGMVSGEGIEVVHGDGYAALEAWNPIAAHPVVLVDPPYTRREEWDQVPAAAAAAVARLAGCSLMIWYPIKAFTRPHQLQHALRRAGVSATAIDLVSTPVELRKNALAGSGIALVNPPDGLVGRLSSSASVLGPALATRPPAWELRITSW